MARFAPLYDVEIAAASADVRLTIDRRDKLGLGGPGGAAQLVTIQLKIESPASPAQVEKLSEHAERACHAARSLALGVPVESETLHNGQRIGRED